jgi:hypothetical protein
VTPPTPVRPVSGKWALPALALVWLCLGAPMAAAQPKAADAATIAAARELGREGIELYRQGKYAEALDRLTRAHELVGLTTTGLWRARCLVKLSRWVEADAALVAVSEMALPEGAKPVHVEAKKSALREHQELAPRIPRLTLEPADDIPADTEVLLDGRVLSRAEMRSEHLLDPGRHVLEARGSGKSAKKELLLGEGEIVHIPLRLVDGDQGATPVFDDDDGGAAALAVGGWIGVGLGAAGLLVGTITGSLAIRDMGRLDELCPERNCPPSHHGDVDAFDGLRTASTASFIAGGVVAAVGLGLIIASSAIGSSREAALRLGPEGLAWSF